jgi:O-antigen ligase
VLSKDADNMTLVNIDEISMAEGPVVSMQRRYPLLYWTTMAYIVGIPNFVHFDDTGRTANPINLNSISVVIQAAITTYLLVVMLLLEKRPIEARKIRVDSGLWVALLLELILATALQPTSRLMPPTTMALFLSLFRLCQWVIAFVLIVALYSRTPARHATELVVELIGRSSWIWLALVWAILPIMPAQVYGGSEEGGPDEVRRLGGQLIQPAHVALLGSMAFFYALLFFPRGLRKWAACLMALLTIFLAGARAQQAGFLVALFLHTIVLSRKPAIRWGMACAIVLALVIGVSFNSSVMTYIRRGQSAETLSSLNDRTRVWQASLEAIRTRPVLGYGYSVGARNAIRDHWRFAHWVPPHAHNEFLQAALDGGVLALVLVLCIYGRVFWISAREVRRGPCQLFLFIVFVQFGLNTLTGGELGYQYRGTGAVLILCCVGVLSGAAEKVGDYRVVRRATSSALNPSLEGSAF